MATSQNGWSVLKSAPSGRTPWVTGRVRSGDVATIFNYLGKRFDAEVENIRVDWSWGWAYRAIRGATSGYSNHASGTAIDLNAPAHPLGKSGTFTVRERDAIRKILRDLDGVVRWGGDYSGRKDEMHFEINASAAAVARVAKRLRSPAPTPKPASKPAGKTFSVMTWNVENTNDGEADVAAICKLVAAEKPDVVCLQEGYRLFLGDVPGYREVYHASKGYPINSENRAQAILVRDGVSVKVKAPIVMALSWRGPKMGVKHAPRVHRYVTVNKHRKNWRVSTWHVPFGPKPVEETRKAAISWLKRMGLLGPAIAVGDWNALASGLVAKVGRPAGATVDGGGLDKAVFRGCKKVKGENFGKLGRSDHPAKIWTFEA